MTFLIFLFFALVAGTGATPDPTKYCVPMQYMVTQVGTAGAIVGGNAMGGMHRIFSVKDYVNGRFYSNYSITLVDTSNGGLSTVEYQIIVDIAENAKYVITNMANGRECKKYPIPEEEKHPPRCLSDEMTYQGSSDIGAFKGSPDAIRSDTFTSNLGMTGQRSVAYVQNPDDPEGYLQVREDTFGSVIDGSVNVPSLTSNTGPSVLMFSSDFVDYEAEVDEAKFRVPDYCPTDDSLDDERRSRRALSAKHFRLAHYADILFAYGL